MAGNALSLAQIPPEYLEVLEQKFAAATGAAATDADVLTVVERLIADTRAGMVWDESGNQQHIVVNQAAYWDEAQIATETGLDGAATPSKAMQLISAVAFVAVLAFAIYYFAFGRNQQSEAAALPEAEAIATDEAAGEVVQTELLSLGDELGGQVQIGQPATLEIRGANGMAVTLSVINAPIKNRQMPILEAMRAGELVAEWVQGTAVNQVYGIPPAWFAQAGIGQTVLVRTDTGAVYHFVCVEQPAITGQQTELFAQDRPGVTLFPLPAPASPIAVLWCPYNPEREGEAIAGGLSSSMGETVAAGDVRLTVDEWTVNEGREGQLLLDIYGRIQATGAHGSVILSLNTPTGKYTPTGAQYQATAQEAAWLAQFVLPPVAAGTPLQLEARALIGGVVLIDLGRLPDLKSYVAVDVPGVTWHADRGEVELEIALANTHPNSTILLTENHFTAQQGGETLALRLTEPTLPYLLGAGERARFKVRLTPAGPTNLNVSVFSSFWEIRGIPQTTQ